MTQSIEKDRLGPLSKIGRGGQGVVYHAPNAKATFGTSVVRNVTSMVYKEYHAKVLAAMDFSVLAAMPKFLKSLPSADAERLISIGAWPCATVEVGGAPTGFLMPVIPETFYIPLTTVKGVSQVTAEFQHLLNPPSVLVERRIALDDVQRYTLLREAASALAFLHKNGVCVGDISPKNLLFSLAPTEGVYFVDCDTMCIDGVSSLPQAETPKWEVPSGEELGTIYSDTYKLGLLALRLLAGDQNVKDPQALPSTTPVSLQQIITETLSQPPEKRPLPEAWTYVLGHAIEEAQHQLSTAPVAYQSPVPTSPPASTGPQPTYQPTSRNVALGAAIAVAVVAVVALIAILAQSHNNTPSNLPQVTGGPSALPPPQEGPGSTNALPPPTAVNPPAINSNPVPPPSAGPPTTTAQPHWDGPWLRNYWEGDQDCNSGGLDYWVVQPGGDTGMYALKLGCFRQDWVNTLNTQCQSYHDLPPGKCAVWDQDSIMSTFGKHGDLQIVALTRVCLDRAGLRDFHEGPLHQDCVVRP